jgi:glycosyltransferase involved in cell wall biosynthesis
VEVAGDAGLAFSRSGEDLAEKLGRVLVDSGLRAELGRRALSCAREHYTWDRIADEYEYLFARLLRR